MFVDSFACSLYWHWIFSNLVCHYFNYLYTGNPLIGTLAISEDPDEMKHNTAFHQGMDCLLSLKQLEMHHNLNTYSCFLKYL